MLLGINFLRITDQILFNKTTLLGPQYFVN